MDNLNLDYKLPKQLAQLLIAMVNIAHQQDTIEIHYEGNEIMDKLSVYDY